MHYLHGKKILIGITASIAAYKSIQLVRLFIKAGAEVKVIMTPSSKTFVSPLVLSVLSKNKVYIEWEENSEWNNHVALGRWADVFIIAPLSCNTLAKMAGGHCDNLLMAVYLSAVCPVLIAPAMDEDMWHHQAVKRNIQTVKEFGVELIDVDSGELASGLNGDGRMAEPDAIYFTVLEKYCKDTVLNGYQILITAGPTYEPIDPVRFIGNRSSGKMGFAIAKAFYFLGAEVILITGPTHETHPFKGITTILVETAEEMFTACLQYEPASIKVMSAAVADYTPVLKADQKIKKKDAALDLSLKKTKDILKHFGANKTEHQYLAGFALETENELLNATNKLKEKNADCMILNSLNDPGAGFGKDTNKITILSEDATFRFELASKDEVADDIAKFISKEFFRKIGVAKD